MAIVPRGFHFSPTDEELITLYLRRRCMRQPLPSDVVIERDLYSQEPWKVLKDTDPWDINTTTDHKSGKKETIIYVLTELKNMGKKISRTAGCGTWDGQTGSTDVFNERNELIGLKKMFVFQVNKGTDPRLIKEMNIHGHWIMHEYSLPDSEQVLDHFVVCKIKRDYSKSLKVGHGNLCVRCPRTSQDSGKRKLSEEESPIQKKMCYGQDFTASVPLPSPEESPIQKKMCYGQDFTASVPLPSPEENPIQKKMCYGQGFSDSVPLPSPEESPIQKKMYYGQDFTASVSLPSPIISTIHTELSKEESPIPKKMCYGQDFTASVPLPRPEESPIQKKMYYGQGFTDSVPLPSPEESPIQKKMCYGQDFTASVPLPSPIIRTNRTESFDGQNSNALVPHMSGPSPIDCNEDMNHPDMGDEFIIIQFDPITEVSVDDIFESLLEGRLLLPAPNSQCLPSTSTSVSITQQFLLVQQSQYCLPLETSLPEPDVFGKQAKVQQSAKERGKTICNTTKAEPTTSKR